MVSKSHSPSRRTSKAAKPKPRPKDLKDRNRNLELREQKLKVVILASVVVNLVLLGAVGLMAMGKVEGGQIKMNGLPETRPSSSYRGQTREAYMVAEQIPPVLDAVYCYCYCKENFNHRSLLGCFIEEHAANCDVCQKEALRAQQLWDEGEPVQDIADQIDTEFG